MYTYVFIVMLPITKKHVKYEYSHSITYIIIHFIIDDF